MNEIITQGLMKEGSLSAKIYFLFLAKPVTQTDISKILYSGKTQLANIKKNIEKLEKNGYIVSTGRKAGKGENYNRIYYQSTLKPLMEFIELQVKYRKKSSKSKNKKILTKEEKLFLEIFLKSNWFKRFYSQTYLNLDLECEGKRNNRICSCPIRFFARLLEEIFAITESFGYYGINFNKSIAMDDFDEYLKENVKSIDSKKRKVIKKVVKYAKEGLGNYQETNKTLDFYFYNLGVLFLPFELSKKLSTLGRIPLTVSNAFNDSLNYVLYNQ